MKKSTIFKFPARHITTLLLVGFSLICIPCLCANAAESPVPVTTDSRIKTLVYNENEVFNVITHYGYQSNIEFGTQEEIDTISLGDKVPFQVIPAGRRLFIRAQTVNARTNMTVITNKRTYQFDLASVPAPVMPNEELVYVIRFYYPDDKKNSVIPQIEGVNNVSYDNSGNLVGSPSVGYNYKYTFTGSNNLAPLKVYDDGKTTYFKLRSMEKNDVLKFYTLDTSNKENLVYPRISGEYYTVNTVAERFLIEKGSDSVFIYNDNLYHK